MNNSFPNRLFTTKLGWSILAHALFIFALAAYMISSVGAWDMLMRGGVIIGSIVWMSVSFGKITRIWTVVALALAYIYAYTMRNWIQGELGILGWEYAELRYYGCLILSALGLHLVRRIVDHYAAKEAVS